MTPLWLTRTTSSNLWRWLIVAGACLWLCYPQPVAAYPVDSRELVIALSGSRPFIIDRKEASVAELAKCGANDSRFTELDTHCGYAIDTLRETLRILCDSGDSSRYCAMKLAQVSSPGYGTGFVKNGDTAVKVVAGGDADVAVGNISMTSVRDKVVDFSVPLYADGGLQLLTRRENAPPPGLLGAMGDALGKYYQLFVGAGIGLILIALMLHTTERRARVKPDGMPPQPFTRRWYRQQVHGIQEFLWYVSTTFLGQGERHPQRWASRSLVLGLVLTGSVVLSAFNAAVTTELTSQELTGRTKTIDGFMQKGKKIIYVTGTTGNHYYQKWYDDRHGNAADGVPASTFDEAIEKLRGREGDALIYDGPTEQYYANTLLRGEMVTAGAVFQQEHYAMVLPKATSASESDDDFRDAMNRALLQLSENGILAELAAKWQIGPSTRS